MTATPARRDPEGYADLRDYAPIGDGRTIALVARDGRIDWLPLPDLDSAPPFAALLDAEHGGCLELAPVGQVTGISRRYLPGTNVLETTYRTAEGEVVVTDSLSTGLAGRLPWGELARRVDGVRGRVAMRAAVAPGTMLGEVSPWVADTVQGPVLRVGDLTLAVRVGGHAEVTVGRRQVEATFETEPGSRHVVGVVSTHRAPLLAPPAEDIDAGVDRTVGRWREWRESYEYDGPWPEVVQRSALTLKQLIHAPTGAIAAAATTSLPESRTTAKNWDYRYSWVRDTAYSLTALFQLGVREETHQTMGWLLRLLRDQGDWVGVLHRLDGTVPPAEVTEHDVPGWRGHQPVVTGNRASAQLQLGVYGDVFSIVQLYVDNGGVLDAETGRLMARIADLAADQWRRRDAGMWELPEQHHHTTSKLGCWHALTHAVHLHSLGQVPGDADRWRHEAEAIRGWVEAHGWSEELGAYEMWPGSGKLDSSILLHAISGFDRGPRMQATLDALRRQLGAGPHLYRYSGMAAEEGSFVASSYWMVSALALCGRVDEARELMAELVDGLNDVGVAAEMVDPESGDYLGNLPQALSHLAILHAALTLRDVERGEDGSSGGEGSDGEGSGGEGSD